MEQEEATLIELVRVGGFQQQDGGSHRQDGGFQEQDGGSQLQGGGSQLQDGGFQQQDGGSQLQGGGFQQQDGGSQLQAGGFQQQDGGSQLQDGGSQQQAESSSCGYGPHCQDLCLEGFISNSVIQRAELHDADLKGNFCRSCGECALTDALKVEQRSEADAIDLQVWERNEVKLVRWICGSVDEVSWKEGRFARKDYGSPDGQQRRYYEREVAVAKAVSHPNVLPIFAQGSRELGEYCLYMELMNFDLVQFIIERDRLRNLEELVPSPEELLKVAVILFQVANGMRVLHNRSFVHGDLKLDNILLKLTCSRSKYPQVKVSDFGKCRPIEGYSCEGMHPVYAAPEVKDWMKSGRSRDASSQEGKRQDLFKFPTKVDVFSFGIIIYQLLSGDYSLSTNVRNNGTISTRKHTRTHVTPEKFSSLKEKLEGRKEGLLLVSLSEKCRAPKPEDRPDFEGICETIQQIFRN